jgi:hypothetical protein
MMFRRGVTIAVLLIFAVATAPGQQGTTPGLTSLRFLLGDWTAVNTAPGESGGFAFSLGVQDRIMTRTNFANYAARDGRPASRHDDFMIIYTEDGALKADYFDSEQHVIRYVVQPRSDHEVVFASDAKPSEPRYRLSYSARSDGTLVGQFEVAPPGQPEAFKPYLSWTARTRR